MAAAIPRSRVSEDLKAQRVRQLLSNYYGSDVSEPSDPGVPPVRTQKQESDRLVGATDLDSKDFNIDKYLTTVMRDTRLDKLLASSAGMSSDIKSLDADMQRLVYENYNRFITATDTIRDLKGKIDAASPTMAQLQQTSEEIERCREAVRAKLQRRQEQVSDLNDVQALLLKLESVFNLPQRLRVAIDAGAYAVAVDCYIAARPVLNRAGYKGTLRRVAADVAVMVKELTAALKSKVVAHSPNAVECIGLIRRLGGPVADLQDEFLRCMNASVMADLASAQQRLDAASGSAAVEERDPEAVFQILHELQQTYFPEMMSNSRLFAELFDTTGRPALIRVCRELVSSYQNIVKSMLDTLATASAASAARQAMACSRDSNTSSAASDWGVHRMAAALELVVGDLLQLHPLLPELSLQDRAAETSEKCIRHHVAACVAALGEALWSFLPESVDTIRPMQLQQQLAEALQAAMSNQLQSLYQYASKPSAAASWQEGFEELLQGSVRKLLLLLLYKFMVAADVAMQEDDDLAVLVGLGDMFPTVSASQPQSDYSSNTRLLLAMAAFCLYIREQAVQGAAALLTAVTRATSASASFDAPRISRTADQAFKSLVNKYCQAHAAPMVAAVRQDVRGGPRDVEPTACRPFCATWARCLGSATQELMALQEDPQLGGNNRLGLTSERLGVTALSASSPLFSSLTKTVVLPGIIEPALGALIETLRLQTLSCGALHQVQADVHALKDTVLRHVATYAATTTLSMLDQAVITAAERCLNPVLLTSAAIQKIVGQTQIVNT